MPPVICHHRQTSLSQGALVGLTEIYDRSGDTLLLADSSTSSGTWLTLAQIARLRLESHAAR